jgi:hypothetical protein
MCWVVAWQTMQKELPQELLKSGGEPQPFGYHLT